MAWSGGLPPAARQRVDRARAGSAAVSLLSAPAALTLAEVGLEPVGEVMGCAVVRRPDQRYGCGSDGYLKNLPGRPVAPPPLRASRSGVEGAVHLGAGDHAIFAAERDTWTWVVARLVQEASSLLADGVVGIRLSTRPLEAAVTEHLALGTAVRWRRPPSGGRDAEPWTTDLDGQQVSAAVNAGWMPRRLLIGAAMAVRHDTAWTRRQLSRWNTANQEVPGLTRVLSAARRASRLELERAAGPGPGHQVVLSAVRTELTERGCTSLPDEGGDHVARAFAVGTLLAHDRWGVPAAPTLRVLPLTDRWGRR